MKVQIKTPISYYGGKQQLLSTILPIIPTHHLYCEPFCGGAAVFWGKEPSPVEVINDLNSRVVNFYRIMQTKFEELYEMVQATLHSRLMHNDADVMYKNPHLFTDVQLAWAFWIQCNQGFGSNIGKGWAYARKSNSCEKKTDNTKERFKEFYKDRLKHVQIECNNAMKVIASRDTEDAFFYCDPPYPQSNQGHYEGYMMSDFMLLLDLLAGIKGKFLLSSYDYPELTEAAKKHGWYQFKKEMTVSVVKGTEGQTKDKKKIEVFTSNFPI
jgi:DNA adenine methylase